MLRSMTAYASHDSVLEDWSLTWELRSVNHRFLDVSLRLPDAFRFLESDVRARIGASLRRGRVECTLIWKKAEGTAGVISLNAARLRAVLDSAKAVEEQAGRSLAPFSALDVLGWPGVLEDRAADRERLGALALASLDEVLVQAVTAREREGESLAALLRERLLQIGESVARVRVRMPEVLRMQREKLQAKLAEVSARPDADRMEQELVYWAQKLDVAEEMDRLSAHVEEFLRSLETAESVGRRLDFLSQEMNREANTLGSKSSDIETTRAAMEIKVLIEQIREQVQNVE
ncbi:YicC/YloC family endoribonuclease [Methylolobus aquaticus]